MEDTMEAITENVMRVLVIVANRDVAAPGGQPEFQTDLLYENRQPFGMEVPWPTILKKYGGNHGQANRVR